MVGESNKEALQNSIELSPRAKAACCICIMPDMASDAQEWKSDGTH